MIEIEGVNVCIGLSHMFPHLAKFESKIQLDPPGLRRGVRSMNL